MNLLGIWIIIYQSISQQICINHLYPIMHKPSIPQRKITLNSTPYMSNIYKYETKLYKTPTSHAQITQSYISINEEYMQQIKANSPVSRIEKKNKSFDQIGISKCKVFQNKVKLKSFTSDQYKLQGQEGIQKQRDGKKNSSFAELYRINLRRTVFNETKQMIKKSKMKQHSLHSIENLSRQDTQNSRTLESNLTHYNTNKTNQSLEPQKIVHNMDNLSKSLAKRQIQKQIHAAQNQELGVSKLPIITKNNDEEINNKFSNLFKTLKMKEAAKIQKRQRKKQAVRRDIEEKNGKQLEGAQEIIPWETFADQFID